MALIVFASTGRPTSHPHKRASAVAGISEGAGLDIFSAMSVDDDDEEEDIRPCF